MKKKLFFVCFVYLFMASVLGAAITADQWSTDFSLYQEYMNSTPKNYLAAVNITKKWVDYADQDAAQVAAVAGEGVTKESLTAALNNVYREATDVICNNYNSLMVADPVKAAEFAINLQSFFTQNNGILEGFAAANNSSVAHMKNVIDQAIKDGILKTYSAAAIEYSKLAAAGKNDEAAKLSADWQKVVSTWNANNSPIPGAFNSFAGVDTEKTVTDLKEFEKDYAAWREAVKNGDENQAFSLVNKWIDFEKTNPERAIRLQYIYGASSGTAADDKTNWKTTFVVATYESLWAFDVKAYETAIVEGRLADAIDLIKKWEKIFAGEFGDAVAKQLGSDKAQMLTSLADGRTKLENVDSTVAGENVASFKQDLAEHAECGEKLAQTEAGSSEWYTAMARAIELADKWSKVANENPTLAAEIQKATGIELPSAADENIKQLLQATVNDSAQKFNTALGSGDLQSALDIIKAWREYLKNHSRASEIAETTWPGFNSVLERYQTGLEIMTGADQVTETPDPTEAADTTEEPAAQSSSMSTLGVTAQ